MLFGLVGGIALGLVVGRTTKHEIAFVTSATPTSSDPAAWLRAKPAGVRTRPEPAAPEPVVDYIAGLSQFNDVLAFTAGIGDTPSIARADSPVRRK
jgi:hypothetical protein